jgi:hypothetical protein
MTRFQKIAVGLLGFTNPEMFIPIFKATQASSANGKPAARTAPPADNSQPARDLGARAGCES